MMKKALTCLTVLGGLLGAGAANALPVAIHFDGYCDGISNIAQEGDVVTGLWNLTACGTGNVYPAVGLRGNSAGKAGQTGFYDRSMAAQPGILVRINDNGTWEYHDELGNYINSGTWSPVGAEARVGTGVSTLGR